MLEVIPKIPLLDVLMCFYNCIFSMKCVVVTRGTFKR